MASTRTATSAGQGETSNDRRLNRCRNERAATISAMAANHLRNRRAPDVWRQLPAGQDSWQHSHSRCDRCHRPVLRRYLRCFPDRSGAHSYGTRSQMTWQTTVAHPLTQHGHLNRALLNWPTGSQDDATRRMDPHRSLICSVTSRTVACGVLAGAQHPLVPSRGSVRAPNVLPLVTKATRPATRPNWQTGPVGPRPPDRKTVLTVTPPAGPFRFQPRQRLHLQRPRPTHWNHLSRQLPGHPHLRWPHQRPTAHRRLRRASPKA